MRTIATIGYEGATPQAFDKTLADAGIDTLVDVRAIALSRRRGFSKTALSERVCDAGFEYIHLPDLGDPKPGREAARAGDLALFREIFDAHLATLKAQAALQELTALAAERCIALLCYEADPATCHRSILAEEVALVGDLSILHLRVGGTGITCDRVGTYDHSCEGVAAT